MSNVQHGNQPEGQPEVVHGDQPLLEDDDARVQVVVHGTQPAENPPTSDDVGDDEADEPASGDSTGAESGDELPPVTEPTSSDVAPSKEPDGEEG